MKLIFGTALVTGLAAVVAPAGVAAQHSTLSAYPTKPVRMVVPLAPGGGSDIVGRLVAQALSEHWGKPVVVDNRPGAGTAVGTSIAAKASPDGYTMLVSSSSIAISPALYKTLDFDIVRDFVPVTLLASQPSLLAVHPSVAAKTLKDLLALAASSPGRIPYASAGIGSATHLGTELLMYTSKVSLLHVPYKSAGLATGALLAGEAQVLPTNMASLLPHVSSGKVRAIGISSLKRSPLAPQVPDVERSGPCRVRVLDVVRDAHAGAHAGQRGRPGAGSGCAGPERAAHRRAPHRAGPADLRHVARRIPGLSARRDRQVGESRQSGAHQSRLIRRARKATIAH